MDGLRGIAGGVSFFYGGGITAERSAYMAEGLGTAEPERPARMAENQELFCRGKVLEGKMRYWKKNSICPDSAQRNL